MNAQLFHEPLVSEVDRMPADMASPRPPAPRHLAPVGTKAVELDCDGGRLSSDAGIVLLKDIDAPLGFTRHLAAVLSDPRDPRRINFTQQDLIKPRGLHMAAGDEEANDANTLRDDPIFKLLRDRLPETGAPVASQPTLSRFANRVSRPELSRMALVLLEPFLTSSTSPPQGIVLEVDAPEDPVHGEQAQARYDGYYGGDCCMPLHLYEGLAGRLITTILKATRFTGAQRLAVVKRLGKRLRHVWPTTVLRVRGDSHGASPEMMQWSAEQPHMGSVTGLTSHTVLQTLAQEVIEQAKRA